MAINLKKGEVSHFRDLEAVRATYGIILRCFAGAAGCDGDTVDAAPMVAEKGSTHDRVLSCATLAFHLAAALQPSPSAFILSLSASVPPHRPPQQRHPSHPFHP